MLIAVSRGRQYGVAVLWDETPSTHTGTDMLDEPDAQYGRR